MIIDLIIYTPMFVTGFWFVLLFSSSKPVCNRPKLLLSGFMLVAFLLYCSHAVYFKHRYSTFILFDPVYTFSSLSVYPLYFWYIKLLTVEDRIKRKNWSMFLPALIFALGSASIYFIMGKVEGENFVRNFYYNEGGVLTREGEIQRIVFFGARLVFAVQVIYFLLQGSVLVKRYNKRIANFYSNVEGKSIAWVDLLLKSFVATSLMSIVFNLLGKSSFLDSGYVLIIPSAIFSSLLFLIGYQGFLQKYTVADLIIDEDKILAVKAVSFRQLSKDKLRNQLLELFNNEGIYVESSLKITMVAEALNTNRTYLSKMINEEFNCTFSDFVAGFRVQKAKELFSDDPDNKYSIDCIAEQVGFGSTSSFIRMFKKFENETPGSYRAKLNTDKRQVSQSLITKN